MFSFWHYFTLFSEIASLSCQYLSVANVNQLRRCFVVAVAQTVSLLQLEISMISFKAAPGSAGAAFLYGRK